MRITPPITRRSISRSRIADTVHIYSFTATANLGIADLTSATAYWQRAEHQLQDASELAVLDANGVYPYVAISCTLKSMTAST